MGGFPCAIEWMTCWEGELSTTGKYNVACDVKNKIK